MVTDRWNTTSVGIIAVIAIAATLKFASAVFAPVAGAIFIIAIIWPLQSNLQRFLPKLISLAIVVLVTVAIFLLFASLASWGFGRVGRSLLADAGRFQALYEQVTAWLEMHGIVVASLVADHFNVRWMIGTIQGIAAHLNTTLVFWLVMLVYVVLGLLEVDDIWQKLQKMGERDIARTLLNGGSAMAVRFRRYILIRTLMSLATGFLVWALATFSGLQLAVEWGVIAFVLNYIPFIGPFIATLFPTLFALAQFDTWEAVLAIFVCLNIIQFVIGSYIEPRVAGSILSMSPFVVLFSVFLWTYLWGFFGAFIGVPITIAVLTFCAQHPSSRWVAELLGRPEAEARNI